MTSSDGSLFMPDDYSRRWLITATASLLAAPTLVGTAAARRPLTFSVNRSKEEWRTLLGTRAYRVLRRGATEQPYSSPLLKEKRAGIYSCAGCAQRLFLSQHKFGTTTGWPSFYHALKGSVVTRVDRSLNPPRDEALCSRCGGHLGHLFGDGPRPTGLRYCMNGVALQFLPA
jgi:peptide-methionine (R)-S-oxide reductase